MIFKYFNFFADSIYNLLTALGVSVSPVTLVALVPGAGDWVLSVCGVASCANAVCEAIGASRDANMNISDDAVNAERGSQRLALAAHQPGNQY